MTRGLVVVALSLWLLGLSAAGAQVRPSLSAATPGAIEHSRFRVLFVGNSYTRFHAMPLMVRAALRGLPRHPRVEIETIAHPGWTLQRHLAGGLVQRRIARGGFTHVVLQGHSLSAIEDAGGLREAVRALHGVSRASGASTVLYETWARRADAPSYRRAGAPETPEEMTARIGETYAAIARDLQAPVAPAGRAFAIARAEHPEIELYRADGSHPSEAGSYLVACTLAGVLSGEDPRELRYVLPGLSRPVARTLREVAARAITAGP